MQAITGIVKDGQIITNEPADWPNGTRVRIEPLHTPEDAVAADAGQNGSTEDPQNDDPESVAQWLAEFDAIPPLQMTPDEEAEWQAARAAQREFEKRAFVERAEKLRGMSE
jgi:hypothetical protein